MSEILNKTATRRTKKESSKHGDDIATPSNMQGDEKEVTRTDEFLPVSTPWLPEIELLVSKRRKGELEQTDVGRALDKLADEFAAVQELEKSVFRKTLSKLFEEELENSMEDTWHFTDEERSRTSDIEKIEDLAQCLQADMQALGLRIDRTKVKAALLIPVFRKINQITWQKTGTLKGTQTLLTGPPGSGKTLFFDTLLSLIDADMGYPHGVVKRYSSSSGKGLVFSAGEDGDAHSNKIIAFEEMTPHSTDVLQMIWSTTTAGFYTHLSSGEEQKSGKRKTHEYKLMGPLHHIMTSVHSPREWDSQFVSRSLSITFAHTKESRLEICKEKMSEVPKEAPDRRLILRSWNGFFERLRKIDPEERGGFVDLEMNDIKKHIYQSFNKDQLSDDDPRRLDILIMLIAAHAVAHQHKRKRKKTKDGRDILCATKEDLNGVIEIFNNFVQQTSTKVVHKAEAEAFKTAAPWFEDKYGDPIELTQRELEIKLQKSERTVRDYLKSWRGAGLVELSSSGYKNTAHYKRGPMWDLAKKEVLKELDQNADNLEQAIAEKALEMTYDHSACFQLKQME